MKIVNKTRKITLSKDAEYRDSFLGRLKGLMLSKTKKDIVLSSPKESIEHATIHMLFMLYPIDVIWVNSNGFVVDIARRIKPGVRIYKPKKPARYVVELGKGETGATGIGDKIQFQ